MATRTALPAHGGAVGGWGQRGNDPLADKPVLIALGDSISSGHHHQVQDGQVKLICDAPDYSYAAEVYRRLAARPGKVWADPGQYHNLAHSGFGTSTAFWPKGTVAGGVLDGGTTACMKETAFDTPIVQAVALLKARADKGVRGNKVVITAGINDTNWTEVLGGLAFSSLRGRLNGVTAAQCRDLVFKGAAMIGGNNVTNATWDGPGKMATIAENVVKIVDQLGDADPNVEIYWVEYYNMAGSGGLFSSLPMACADAVEDGLVLLNRVTIYRDGVDASRYWRTARMVASTGLDHSRTEMQQDLPGWPHPNPDGHKRIATEIVELLPS